MKSSTFHCEICSRQRGAVNHWFVFFPVKSGRVMFQSFDGKAEHRKDVDHICGQGCLLKRIDRALTEISATTTVVVTADVVSMQLVEVKEA